MSTPLYEMRTRASGELGPGPVGDTGGGALVQAAGALMADQRRIEEFDRRQVESAALVSANEDLQGARSYWSEQLTQRKQSAPAGAAGFTSQALKDFDTDAKERIGRAKTEGAREQLRARLADVRLSIQDESQSFELASSTKDRVTRLDNSIESARTAANFRPQDYDKIQSEMLVAIAGSGLSDEQRVAAMENAGQALAGAAVAGLIQKNPYSALRELNNEKSTNSAVQALDLDSRQHARSMAQSEINRIESEARASRQEAQNLLRADSADAFAARALGLPAVLPQRSRYVAAFGNEGGSRFQEDQARWKIYDVAGEAAYQTPQEAAKTLETLKPVTQTGAALGTENFVAAVQIYQRQRKALEDNPVETLEHRDADLAEMHSTAAKDPTQIPAYFSMLRARQQALGIAEPKLLPEGKRAEIAAALVFDIEKPRQRAEVLQALRNAYGDEYVSVMQEVAPKLDGMSRVLIGMNGADASRLDAAYAQKKVLAESMPPKANADIEQSVTAELAQFGATLADNPDGPSRYAEHFEATKLYAQSLVANGASSKDAAQVAAKAVINSQYTYRDGIRIPTTLDEHRMLRGMFEQKQLAAKAGNFVITQMKFSSPEQAQADMRNLIDRHGYWITNERGTGVVLRIPHREGQGEVYFGEPAVQATQLSANDERAYQDWMRKIGHTKEAGFNVDNAGTGTDYDYRGFFKKHGAVDVKSGQHLTDEFKLPNHPTFSVESMYAKGESAAHAGHWDGEKFIPGKPSRAGKRVEFTWEELAATKLEPFAIETVLY